MKELIPSPCMVKKELASKAQHSYPLHQPAYSIFPQDYIQSKIKKFPSKNAEQSTIKIIPNWNKNGYKFKSVTSTCFRPVLELESEAAAALIKRDFRKWCFWSNDRNPCRTEAEDDKETLLFLKEFSWVLAPKELENWLPHRNWDAAMAGQQWAR